MHISFVSNASPRYRDPILKAGFQLDEYDLPLSEESKKRFDENSDGRFLLFNIESSQLELIGTLFEAVHRFSGAACIIDTLTSSARNKFIECGISDVMISPAPDRLISFLKTFEKGPLKTEGTIVVFEDNAYRMRMIGSIITRFGFVPSFVHSVENAVEQISNAAAQLFLLNIGTGALAVPSLVRAYISQVQLKRIPCIAYRDMTDGIFVHEMISGLNKLTRVILSHVELYNFLVNTLVQKELFAKAGQFASDIDLMDGVQLAAGPLRTMYLQRNEDLLCSPTFCNGESIEDAMQSLGAMHAAIVKAYGFSWLKDDKSPSQKLTCGVYASS